MRDNIFTNLIKDEDSFTEGFVNLLQFKEVQKAFNQMLTKTLDQKIKIGWNNGGLQVETQVQEEGGRPDIKITFEGKVLLVEVKVRCSTGLTDKQKKLYEVSKEKGKEKYLLFGIPKGHHSEEEINSIVNNKPNVNFFYWEDLFEYWEDLFEELKKGSQQDYSTTVIHDFIEIYKEKFFMDYEVFFEDKEKKIMLEGEVGNIIWNLNYILWGIKENVKIKSLFAKVQGPKSEPDSNTLNLKLKISGEEKTLNFGMYYGYWQDRGMPLFIGIEREDNLSKEISKVLKKHPKLKEIPVGPGDKDWHIFMIKKEFYKDEKLTQKAGELLLNIGESLKKI